MLSDTKIIALYCIVDDMLKGLHHPEDTRVKMADSEVIATAFVGAVFWRQSGQRLPLYAAQGLCPPDA